MYMTLPQSCNTLLHKLLFGRYLSRLLDIIMAKNSNGVKSPTRDQPPNKRQKPCSRSVLYLEVPLKTGS